MALEGRKIKDNIVMFGEPLNERQLETFKKHSPTANSIIQNLPKDAFIPLPTRKKEPEKKEIKRIEKDTAAERRKQKKMRNRRTRKEVSEKTNIEKAIEEKSLSLEEELEALSQSVKVKQPEPEPEFEEEVEEEEVRVDLKDQVLQLLDGEEDAPTANEINAWKERYGKSGIHVMAFGEGEVYIYHHLTRGEWKKIREIMNRLKESQEPDEVEERLKEKVVVHCVLWPSIDPEWLDYCKAGVVDSLYQMILLNSGFLTPQQAMLLTTRL